MPELFLDRLNLAMEKAAINKTEQARKTGAAPNSITAWTEKGKVPSNSSMLALANALDVNVEWLRTGIGPMEFVQKAGRTSRGLDPEDSFDEDLLSIKDPPYLGVAMVVVKRFLRKRGLGLSDELETKLVVRLMRSSFLSKQNPTEADAERELILMVQGQ